MPKQRTGHRTSDGGLDDTVHARTDEIQELLNQLQSVSVAVRDSAINHLHRCLYESEDKWTWRVGLRANPSASQTVGELLATLGKCKSERLIREAVYVSAIFASGERDQVEAIVQGITALMEQIAATTGPKLRNACADVISQFGPDAHPTVPVLRNWLNQAQDAEDLESTLRVAGALWNVAHDEEAGGLLKRIAPQGGRYGEIAQKLLRSRMDNGTISPALPNVIPPRSVEEPNASVSRQKDDVEADRLDWDQTKEDLNRLENEKAIAAKQSIQEQVSVAIKGSVDEKRRFAWQANELIRTYRLGLAGGTDAALTVFAVDGEDVVIVDQAIKETIVSQKEVESGQFTIVSLLCSPRRCTGEWGDATSEAIDRRLLNVETRLDEITTCIEQMEPQPTSPDTDELHVLLLEQQRIVRSILDRIDRPKSEQRLTEKQAKVFSRLDAMGRTEEDQSNAEKLINAELKGDRVTKPLVEALRRFLDDREWGFECPTCRRPSSPTWQARGNNGTMQFQHSSAEGYGKHGGRTLFPHVTIVLRPKPTRGRTPIA